MLVTFKEGVLQTNQITNRWVTMEMLAVSTNQMYNTMSPTPMVLRHFQNKGRSHWRDHRGYNGVMLHHSMWIVTYFPPIFLLILTESPLIHSHKLIRIISPCSIRPKAHPVQFPASHTGSPDASEHETRYQQWFAPLLHLAFIGLEPLMEFSTIKLSNPLLKTQRPGYLDFFHQIFMGQQTI